MKRFSIIKICKNLTNVFFYQGPLDNFLFCDVDEHKNIRQIDGTLSLITIYEQYLNKNFTSVNLVNNEPFSYGKIEIRASLPITTILRLVIRIQAVNPCYSKYNPKKDCNKVSKGIFYQIIIFLRFREEYIISLTQTTLPRTPLPASDT